MSIAAILCGGYGLRIKGNFDGTPKPLISIHNKKILTYIINQYLKFGVTEFVLLVGSNEEMFRDFAENFSDKVAKIKVLQTGENTPTGGRIKLAEHILNQQEYFFLTYGDGLSDINLKASLAFHKNHKKMATLTAIKPQLPFGLIRMTEDNSILSFSEKPILNEYINGGFFILNNEVFSLLTIDSSFEADTLPLLSSNNELKAYIHDGFWKNVDTFKDYVFLEENKDLLNY